MNTIKALFASRKFMVLLLDVLLSTILYFAGKYASPDVLADVKFLIGAYQPVFLMLIYAIAKEDAAEKGNVANPVEELPFSDPL